MSTTDCEQIPITRHDLAEKTILAVVSSQECYARLVRVNVLQLVGLVRYWPADTMQTLSVT
jgi:hypothetical protein